MGIHLTRAGYCAALAMFCIGTTVIAAPPVDDHLLYLRAGTVNPLDRPSLLDVGATPISANAEHLIKLDGPMTPERRAALSDAGVKLGAYIPRHAWRVSLRKADLDALRRLDFVTWVGEFDPAWKLCPRAAGNKAYETNARRDLQNTGNKRVIVHLESSADRGAMQKSLAACGAALCVPSRPGDADMLVVDVAANRLNELCGIPEIQFVEEAPEASPRNASTAWIAQSNIPNVTSIWDQGLHGENQLIDVIDWDLDELHCAFFDDVPFGDTHRKIQAYYGFDENLLFGWHGTHVVDTLAGDPLGAEVDANLRGMAYAARIVFQDQAATINNINLFDRLRIAHEDGARIHSNSWGATVDNSYNAWARDIDSFSYQNEEDLVVFAVINGGAATPILSPENAKNCLAVGAAGDDGFQDNPGSGGTGPTTDGRQKPEVWMTACNSNSANFGTDCGVIERACATSWAAPATAGMAALTRQYFTDGYYPTGTPTPADALTPSGSLVKATLINSAVDMAGIAGYYGAREGYGRILMDDPLYFAGDSRRLIAHDVRHADGLTTRTMQTYEFDVVSGNEPLKITMVFADVPSTIGTSFAPVNDLNLLVTSPSGQLYRGNVFELGESTTGGTADMLNTTEHVQRMQPDAGRWTIQVIGAEVNVASQGYALVITGDVAAAGGPEADLDVSIEPAGPIDAMIGDVIDADVTIVNMGPDAATNVRVHYALPQGVSIVPGSMTNMSCTAAAELSCTIDSMPPDKTFSVSLQLQVEQAGVFTTSATATSDTFDPLPDNDVAELIVETSAHADLALTVVSAPTMLVAGQTADVIVECRNNGPLNDAAPALTFAADAGLVIESISSCAAMPDAATCELASLANGGTITTSLSVRAAKNAAGTSSIALQLIGTSDANDANNRVSVGIEILPDTDGDGVADADDLCADGDDAQDVDADGVPDGCDECPNDPNKTKFGICDCGVPDTDSDGDGIPDCADFCPNDPEKLMPGDCGCGVSEEDSNGNGVPDCLDTPIDNPDPEGEMNDETAENGEAPFWLDDLDPCFVRYVLQSFLGIPLCGPCISFSMVGSMAGIALMRRRQRRRRLRRRI